MNLDTSSSNPTPQSTLSTCLPVPGDVLWCLAPYKPRDLDAPIVPGPVPHPVLVLAVYTAIAPIELLIVPGTGTLGSPYAHLDFTVEGGTPEATSMGLSKSTRFKISGIDRIPFLPNLFIPHPNSTAGNSKIGNAPSEVIALAREKYGELIKYVQKIKNR